MVSARVTMSIVCKPNTNVTGRRRTKEVKRKGTREIKEERAVTFPVHLFQNFMNPSREYLLLKNSNWDE